jgi:hypothetical protein
MYRVIFLRGRILVRPDRPRIRPVSSLEFGKRVFFATRLFDLSDAFWAASAIPVLFPRPERRDNGEPTFRLLEGESLPTSNGHELRRQAFGTAPRAVMALSRTNA